MTSHSDMPFIVTAALLLLWGSGKSDSNVTFCGVTFACAYVLVQAMAAAADVTSGKRSITFSADVMPQTNYFEALFEEGDEKSLGYFLLSLFCFGFGIVGTTTFAISPFLGTVLYSVIVSALFRDESVVGDVRIVVWICVILSGALSEHVFRLNLVALVIGSLLWENKLTLPQRGALESVCFVNGVIFLTIHDLIVRFILEPVKALLEAGFLGMTAYVMVNSALELGALPARSMRPWDPLNPDLLRIRWSDCLVSTSTPFDRDFPRRIALAAPVLSSLFCTAYLVRTLRANKRDLDWLKWQQIFGVGVGTALGLHLWTRYSVGDSMRMTSPITVCWVSTALLFYSSTMLNASAQTAHKHDLWHQVYWRGLPDLFGRKAGKEGADSTRKKREATPYPTLLLGSFSATYPEIYDIALTLEGDYYALESNMSKLRVMDRSDQVAYARQSFNCAQLVSTLLKHCEDLTSKLDARAEVLAREAQVFAAAAGESSQAAAKSRQRGQLLQQDSVAIHSYSDLLKREQSNRDEQAKESLEAALKVVAARPPATSAAEELKLKQEADELDSMCEAVRRRIKHRRKKETDQLQQQQQQQDTQQNPSARPSAPPPPPSVESPEGGRSPLPIISSTQSSMFPSDRDANSKASTPSPSKKRQGLFRGLLGGSKRKAEPASSSPPGGDITDRQSAGSGASGSAKRGWFGSGKKNKSPTS